MVNVNLTDRPPDRDENASRDPLQDLMMAGMGLHQSPPQKFQRTSSRPLVHPPRQHRPLLLHEEKNPEFNLHHQLFAHFMNAMLTDLKFAITMPQIEHASCGQLYQLLRLIPRKPVTEPGSRERDTEDADAEFRVSGVGSTDPQRFFAIRNLANEDHEYRLAREAASHHDMLDVELEEILGPAIGTTTGAPTLAKKGIVERRTKPPRPASRETLRQFEDRRQRWLEDAVELLERIKLEFADRDYRGNTRAAAMYYYQAGQVGPPIPPARNPTAKEQAAKAVPAPAQPTTAVSSGADLVPPAAATQEHRTSAAITAKTLPTAAPGASTGGGGSAASSSSCPRLRVQSTSTALLQPPERYSVGAGGDPRNILHEVFHTVNSTSGFFPKFMSLLVTSLERKLLLGTLGPAILHGLQACYEIEQESGLLVVEERETGGCSVGPISENMDVDEEAVESGGVEKAQHAGASLSDWQGVVVGAATSTPSNGLGDIYEAEGAAGGTEREREQGSNVEEKSRSPSPGGTGNNPASGPNSLPMGPSAPHLNGAFLRLGAAVGSSSSGGAINNRRASTASSQKKKNAAAAEAELLRKTRYLRVDGEEGFSSDVKTSSSPVDAEMPDVSLALAQTNAKPTASPITSASAPASSTSFRNTGVFDDDEDTDLLLGGSSSSSSNFNHGSYEFHSLSEIAEKFLMLEYLHKHNLLTKADVQLPRLGLTLHRLTLQHSGMFCLNPEIYLKNLLNLACFAFGQTRDRFLLSGCGKEVHEFVGGRLDALLIDHQSAMQMSSASTSCGGSSAAPNNSIGGANSNGKKDKTECWMPACMVFFDFPKHRELEISQHESFVRIVETLLHSEGEASSALVEMVARWYTGGCSNREGSTPTEREGRSPGGCYTQNGVMQHCYLTPRTPEHRRSKEVVLFGSEKLFLHLLTLVLDHCTPQLDMSAASGGLMTHFPSATSGGGGNAICGSAGIPGGNAAHIISMSQKDLYHLPLAFLRLFVFALKTAEGCRRADGLSGAGLSGVGNMNKQHSSEPELSRSDQASSKSSSSEPSAVSSNSEPSDSLRGFTRHFAHVARLTLVIKKIADWYGSLLIELTHINH
eukprot:g3170.t1